ncbi:MAG TPA: head GIN domain-containing protein [Flavitalea sp.]|nr:head GIN domain-containing protein [Flavitalea sp.]
MRTLSFLILCFTFARFSNAQEVNDANAEQRQVSSFHKIEVSNGIQLMLTQGGSEAVAVSASDPEYRKNIRTTVSGGVLKIYYDKDFMKQLHNGNKKLKAYVSFKDIDGLEANSGSLVKVQNTVTAKSLEMEATSGAQIKGEFNVSNLDVDQNSGSIVTISGKAATLKVEGSSGSIFDGFDMVSENCDAETSSGAIIHITVNKELNAEASSGGLVHYKGPGMIRNINTSSGGSISKKS